MFKLIKFKISVRIIFSLSLIGGIICYFCNSKEGNCSIDSIHGTWESTCARGYDHCALYRIVSHNGTTAQVTRGCDRDCAESATKWTLGKYQKTSYCKLCCSTEFCNNQLTDPCSKSNSFHSVKNILALVVVSLGLYANWLTPCG